MGDRANIAIQSNGKRVYFYAHWTGCDMPNVARRALQRRQRWDDGAYLARIVFDTLTEGRQGDEAGFGISCEILDNEYPITVINVDTQRVEFEPDPDESRSYSNRKTPCGCGWTFEDYLTQGPTEFTYPPS